MEKLITYNTEDESENPLRNIDGDGVKWHEEYALRGIFTSDTDGDGKRDDEEASYRCRFNLANLIFGDCEPIIRANNWPDADNDGKPDVVESHIEDRDGDGYSDEVDGYDNDPERHGEKIRRGIVAIFN